MEPDTTSKLLTLPRVTYMIFLVVCVCVCVFGGGGGSMEELYILTTLIASLGTLV